MSFKPNVFVFCLLLLFACKQTVKPKNGEVLQGEHSPANNSVVPGSSPEVLIDSDLARLPDDTISVSGFGKDGPLLDWARGLANMPPCVSVLADQVERYYQIGAARSDGSLRLAKTHVFYGAMKRETALDCLRRALPEFDPAATVKTKDNLVELRLNPSGTASFLHWRDNAGQAMVVWDDEEEYLTEKYAGKPAAADSTLVELVATVDRTQGLWSVGTIDYTYKFLQVPSEGYTLSMNMSLKDEIRGTARILFASQSDMKEVKAKIDAFVKDIEDDKVSSELANVLRIVSQDKQLVFEFEATRSQAMFLMERVATLGQEWLKR